MKKCFAVSTQSVRVDFGLLVMRVIIGYAFILHGFGKIQNPFNWMGPDATIPGFLQALAAVAEFGGGVGLILGLFTRLWGFGLLCTMAVATYMHAIMLKDPFVNLKGGSSYELALVYFSISLLFLIIGAGRFSLDKAIFGECK